MVDERRVQQNPDGSQQFALVIAVARSPKGFRELVGTSLQHDGPGAHHFAAFASLVAFGAHAGCQRR